MMVSSHTRYLPNLRTIKCFCTHSRTQSVCHSGHAHKVFDEMPDRDYRDIRSYTADHRYREAISLFNWMRNVDLRPDGFSFAAVVKSSAVIADTRLAQSLHGFAVKGAYAENAAVQKALMDMYARFGNMCDCSRVFEEMGERDSVAWNVLLTGFARAQRHREALGLFHSMHACDGEEAKPTEITAAVVLPICAKLRDLNNGRSIHGYTIKVGLELETLVGNALVSMYAKCGCVMDGAFTMFQLMDCKDVVSWNSVIAGCSENGFFIESFGLFREMISVGFSPNYATVANVLPIFAFVENGCYYGKEIHCYVLRSALEMELSVCNALVAHYAKIRDMRGAESVFRRMHLRDLVTWNTLIAGYALNGWHLRALDVYHDMLSLGLKPDSVTLVSVLPVCVELKDIQEGRKIHGRVIRDPTLFQETTLGNTLISFYGKCGQLDDALGTFKGITRKDLVSWNAMLTTYADTKQWAELLALLSEMKQEGMRPDYVTLLSVLQVCAFLGIRKVKEAHAYSLCAGLTGKPVVGNAVLDAYANCGSLESASITFRHLAVKNVITSNTMISGYLKHGCKEDAEMIFNQTCEKDLTTWNLMLQIYVHNDHVEQAFILFRELQDQGMIPDAISIMSILAACTRLASVSFVRQCHCYAIRTSIHDLHLEAALIDTYSKCGSMNYAHILFRTSPHKDLVTYTAMIRGYATHGMAEEVLRLFKQMIDLGIKLDHVIFTSVLSACSHAGLVEEGWRHFSTIEAIHGIKSTMEHYACMVDLLARGGQLREAYDFIMEMPCEPNANVWGTLLGACKIHRDTEIGRVAANRLFGIEPENIGNYVVMSNIYAAEGRWDGVDEMRKLMKTRDLWKPAGCSWIEIETTQNVFIANDFSHPQGPFIFKLLGSMYEQMKEPLIQQLHG